MTLNPQPDNSKITDFNLVSYTPSAKESEPEEVALNRPAKPTPRLLTLRVSGEPPLVTLLEGGTPLAEIPFAPLSVETLIRGRELLKLSRLNTPKLVTDLEEMGKEFYKHLFPAAIREEFEKNRATGKPLQLHLDLPHALRFVPWEFMHDQHGYLIRKPNLSFSRAAVSTETLELTPLALPLRLLIVVSSPLNLEENHQLDPDREVQLIRLGIDEAIKAGKIKRDEIEIELEDEASLDRLRDVLESFEPHLVHFTGHGFAQPVLDEAGKIRGSRNGLLLEDGQGDKLEVEAQALAELFSGWPQLRLVVLSACQGATLGTGEGVEATAEALVKLGVPAVIAMLESIRDDSATRFARYPYPPLAAAENPAVALAQARQRMYEAGGNAGQASDWAMPVLFQTDPQLSLFSFDRKKRQRPLGKFSGAPLTSLGQNGYFVGRRLQTRQLREIITGNTFKFAIITGIAGQGKSTLTQRVAERFAPAFQGIHALKINKETWRGVTEATLDLARGLAQSGEGRLQATLEEQQRLIPASELGSMCGQALSAGPHLLILDNFEDLLAFTPGLSPRPAEQEVAEWLEQMLLGLGNGSGRVLITCRQSFGFTKDDKHLESICQIGLDRLELGESLRLMNSPAFPLLKQLSQREQIALWEADINTPQIIGWAEVLRKVAGGVDFQNQVLTLHQKFNEAMQLEFLYNSLSEKAQTLLRRASVYFRAVSLSFLSAVLPGAAKVVPELVERRLLEILPERETGQSLYNLHASVKLLGLRKLIEAEGEESLCQNHAQAARHYLHHAREVTSELSDYLFGQRPPVASRAAPGSHRADSNRESGNGQARLVARETYSKPAAK